MSRTVALLFTIGLFALPTISLAQSDPQALAFAAQSLAALTGGTTVNDVTLSGNATLTVGSDVGSGTATRRLNRDPAQATTIRWRAPTTLTDACTK